MDDRFLSEIAAADSELEARYASKLITNGDLDRKLVSFQANKKETGSRWFKYREGFSSALIRYILTEAGVTSGPLLDPFAGSGTSLFTAAAAGIDSVGIELLPSSIEGIDVRRSMLAVDQLDLAAEIIDFASSRSWERPGGREDFRHVPITAGAFPAETEGFLGRFLWDARRVSNPILFRVLRYAAMCVLEEISFTRKDGQYLRWDYRSGRTLGKRRFDKGRIAGFSDAILSKLYDIASDLAPIEHGNGLQGSLMAESRDESLMATIELHPGSCFDVMPRCEPDSFGAIVTSPPYCNRYDYTRTYALELAFMGLSSTDILSLRQTMLSCTVENRPKSELASMVDPTMFEEASRAWRTQPLLTLTLEYLNYCKRMKTLNNPGIPRMVENYFAEMSVVIFEAARILRNGAPFVMVNDNVRYQGAHLPVDLIMSEIAVTAGFEVDAIWVLPVGKGNSSQQMGIHGRQELRKCVYIWRRTNRPRQIYRHAHSDGLVPVLASQSETNH